MQAVGRSALLWLGLGWVAFAMLPWYLLDGGNLFGSGWFAGYPTGEGGPALILGLTGKPWLLPPLLALLLGLVPLAFRRDDPRIGSLLVACGVLGLLCIGLEGFAIDHRGWSFLAAPSQHHVDVGAHLYRGWLSCEHPVRITYQPVRDHLG